MKYADVFFCQAQSSSSFSFAEQTELALISINPATHPFPPPLPANTICIVEQWVAYWSGLATARFVFFHLRGEGQLVENFTTFLTFPKPQ